MTMSHSSRLPFHQTIEDLQKISNLESRKHRSVIPFDLKTPLVSAKKNSSQGCQNYQKGKSTWLNNIGTKQLGQIKHPIYYLFLLCINSGLVDCQSLPCKLLRDNIGKFFPREACNWPSLRDWVIVRASCLLNSGLLNLKFNIITKSFNRTNSDPDGVCAFMSQIPYLMEGFVLYKNANEPWHALTMEIWEFAEWVLNTEHGGDFRRANSRHMRRIPPADVYEQEIRKGLERAQMLGICSNRLWNIVLGSMRKEYDLPALMTDISLTQTPERFAHQEPMSRFQTATQTTSSIQQIDRPRAHNICRSDHCHFASMDSTRVVQLHKCAKENCKAFKLHEPDLSRAQPYTWGMNRKGEPQQGQATQNYIAISHVWSDGTGAADKSVMSCLFQYFCQLARSENCNAIWWDAISVPTEPKARAEVLRRMHLNYRNAHSTIVHDQYTATYPWADDGGPCIALALSPWFTRGWTALELLVSRNVKIIFKDPNPANPNGFVLKDLEKEVLASHPGNCSRGHWIASTAIRRLRTEGIKSLNDLLHILETRSTSWPRDRLVIASLLCGIDPDPGMVDMQAALTRQIVTSFPRIDPGFLLHGRPLLDQTGVFSWCPSTLLLGGNTLVSRGFQGSGLATDRDGSIFGRFTMRVLEKKDIFYLTPVTTDLFARFKMDAAMTNWQHCMLIWPEVSNRDEGERRDPAILVTAIGLSRTTSIDCRMEGIVYGGIALETYHAGVDITLGVRGESPSESALELRNRWCQMKRRPPH